MLHARPAFAMSFARVHQDLVLPTIDELIGLDDETPDWTAKTRIQTTASVRCIPTAAAIARSAVQPRLVPPPIPRTFVPTVHVRTTPPGMHWPVFVCGFVAGIFAGIALLKSPVGHTPGVRRALSEVSVAAHAIVR